MKGFLHEEKLIQYLDPRGKDAGLDRWRVDLYYAPGWALTYFCKSEEEYEKFLRDHRPLTYRGYKEFVRNYKKGGWTMNNYSGHEYIGARYESGLTTKEIASRVRKYLKQKFPGCKFSVRSKYFAGGSELSIALMEAPFEAFQEENKRGYEPINHYALLRSADNPGSFLTNDAYSVLRDVTQYVLSYHRDDSAPEIDYFDTNFYFDLSVGRWDKSFKTTKVEVKA